MAKKAALILIIISVCIFLVSCGEDRMRDAYTPDEVSYSAIWAAHANNVEQFKSFLIDPLKKSVKQEEIEDLGSFISRNSTDNSSVATYSFIWLENGQCLAIRYICSTKKNSIASIKLVPKELTEALNKICRDEALSISVK